MNASGKTTVKTMSFCVSRATNHVQKAVRCAVLLLAMLVSVYAFVGSDALAAAPLITSADNVTFTVGTAGSFTVTTTGVPAASLSETGALPGGVSVLDNGDGTATISGTAAAGSGGSYPLTLTASNGNLPDTAQSFTLNVNEAPAVIFSPIDETVSGGGLADFFANASGVPFPTVQWQVSTDGGANFTDIPFETSIPLKRGAVSDNGNQYRAVFTNSAGTATSTAATFHVLEVTAISPAVGSEAGGTSVVVMGTGFSGTTRVDFGGATATSFTVNSDTQITAIAPVGSGTVDVTVFSGGTTSATVAADQFTYLAPPTVTSISPTAGPTLGGTTVTIIGTNLAGATAVKFGAVNATGITVNSATSMTARSPAGAAGTVDVTVTTPGGTSVTSAADQFTYLTPPTITSISPTFGPPAGGTIVTITGTDFTGVQNVFFGALPATIFTVNSATSISATAPPGFAGGSVSVFVLAAGGRAATTVANQFTYVLLPPQITTDFSPDTIVSGFASTLTYSITNPNAVPLPGVAFTNLFPGGMTLFDASGDCGAIVKGVSSVELQPSTLAANASCTVTAMVTANSPAVYTNVVTVTAPGTNLAAQSTATATLTVNQLPAITSADNVTFTEGFAGSFTVTATGFPTPSVIEIGALPAGVSFTDNGNGTATLAGTPASGTSGTYSLTVEATNTVANVVWTASQAFTLTVVAAPVIVTNPTDQTVTAGQVATFTASATGVPAPTVLWQFSTDGGATFNNLDSGTITNIPGGTASALSFFSQAVDIGTQIQVRAVFSNSAGTVTTTAATLTVNQISQSITFTSTPPNPGLVNGPTYVVAATGGASGNPVTFAIDLASAGACSISGSTVTFLAAGTCTVNAAQAGDATYTAASATQSFTVQDTAGPTAKAIGGFISDRSNLIVSNLFDMNRQIDRLNEAQQGQEGDGGGSNFAENGKGDLLATLKSSRLGSGPTGASAAMAHPDGGQGASALESFLYNYISAAGESGNPLAFNYSGAIDAHARFGKGADAVAMKASLSQMVKWQQQREQSEMQSLGLDHGVNSSTFMPLDIWMEANYATYSGERDGKFGMLTLGADYVFNPSLLAGFYGQFDDMQQHSGTRIHGTGWMAGPYATLRLSDHVFWQGRAGWGQSSNDISTGGNTDHFDSTRWLVSSALSGRWDAGNGLLFSPTASFTYFEDRSKSYVDSLAVHIPGVRTRLGQVMLSPAMSYGFATDDGLWVEPDIATELIWNFASTNIDGLGALDDTATGPKGLRGRVKAGLKVRTPSGITFGASGAYDGIGASGYSAVSGKATVTIPLN